MMNSDSRRDIRAGTVNKVDSIRRSDVLQYDFQLRELLADRRELLLNKKRLSIENICGGVRHLAMNRQGHSLILHGFE